MIENDRDLEAALDVLRGHVGDVEITDVVRPSGGWGNLSYRTDTSAGRFIVTRCMARLESEILEMADLLVHLENVGFPSPRLVPHQDGRILSEWDGCPALVKRYIEGDIPRGIVENI